MHQPVESLSHQERDALAMRQMVMQTFCDLLHATNLAPMTVLEYASAAVGSVYREVADAHTWPSACPCGWQPDEIGDITILQNALVCEAISDLRHGLAVAPVMGNA